MNAISTYALSCIFIALMVIGLHRYRLLAKRAAAAQWEAARFHRHAERLELVLKQIDPEKFAHVKARSDMEWQQTVKHLKEDALPVFFPLETAYTPVASAGAASGS